MKLWLDNVRSAPEGYVWCKNVDEARELIFEHSMYHWVPGQTSDIELIDIGYNAGDCLSDDDDHIELLEWLEETGRNYPIHIHSMNVVGVENMRRIIQRNGWKEV